MLARGHRALVVAMFLALAGCERACGGAHDVTERVGERLISVEHERRLGEQLAGQFRREVPLVDDPVVQRYIDQLGHALVAGATGVPEGLTFDFQVIDAPDTINAIAMPGGFIYVYSGLIVAADSEAELAGVLAHEIAHVVERHVVAQLITAMGIQTLRELALGEETGQLGQLVADFVTRGALGAYSRTAESEADELAIHTLVRAGWDPRGYPRFFDELASGRGEPGLVARFASTHPDPAERARRARELIATLDAIPTRSDDETLRRISARLRR